MATRISTLEAWVAPGPLPRLAALESYPWLVVGTVCIGAFMGQLDVGVVSLVLPTLEEEFHRSLGAVQWTAVAYLLVLTGLLTPLGLFSDRAGRKATYVVGFAVFTLGSVLCALAPGLGLLVAARVLQAVGAAMLQSNSVAIITAATPQEHLGRAIGVQGTAQALGLAFGPAVGGILIDWLGWRWVFLVNVPIGLLAILLARLTLPRRGTRPEQASPNPASMLLLPSAAAAALLAMTLVDQALPWLALAAALVVAFVAVERRARTPLFSRDVVRAPGLKSGSVAALLSYTVLFGSLFAVSLLLERVLRDRAQHAGLILTLLPVALALVAELGGALRDRYGRRLPTVTGMLLAAAGLVVVASIGPGRQSMVYPGLVILGAGLGLFIPANNASLMGAAPLARLGLVGGLVNTMRGLGASFGVALVSLVLAVSLGSSSGPAPQDLVLAGLRLTIAVLVLLAVMTAALSATGPKRYRRTEVAERGRH